MESGLSELEAVLVELLDRLDLPELDAMCEHAWLLRLILQLCELKDAKS